MVRSFFLGSEKISGFDSPFGFHRKKRGSKWWFVWVSSKLIKGGFNVVMPSRILVKHPRVQSSMHEWKKIQHSICRDHTPFLDGVSWILVPYLMHHASDTHDEWSVINNLIRRLAGKVEQVAWQWIDRQTDTHTHIEFETSQSFLLLQKRQKPAASFVSFVS